MGSFINFIFPIFIDDLSEIFMHRKYLLFADNLKLFMPIKSRSDCVSIMTCLQTYQNVFSK